MQNLNPGSLSSSSSSSSPPLFDLNFYNPGTTTCTTGVCWNDATEFAFQEYLIASGGVNQVSLPFPKPPQAPPPYFNGTDDESLIAPWRSFHDNDLENKLMDIECLERQLKSTQDIDRKQVGRGIEGIKVADQQRIAKTAERKQRRMIKNRESAARSRAKKQAYTDELQKRVLELKETNARLKKKNEVIRILDSKQQRPRCQLRRTSSCEF